MTDMHETDPHAGAQGEAPDAEQAHGGADWAAGAQAPPSEREMRAAYEAELNRITSVDMIVQTAISLMNIGGRRLGLAPGTQSERDLEQVRDAIDGVRALMPVLERRIPADLSPLRDALAQLQMAYAREAATQPSQAEKPEQAPRAEKSGQAPRAETSGQAPRAEKSEQTPQGKKPEQAPSAGKPEQAPSAEKEPGPAEASGRLWVPGR